MAKVSAIDPALGDYIRSVSVKEHDALRVIRETTASHPCAKQQIPPEEGQLLATLIKISGAKQILEIGTFTGYSALAMAMALPADGFVTAIDKNPEWTARAQQHWKDAGFDDRIGLRIGDGTALLEELITEKGEGFFDFAFIDADKKNYAAYYSLCIRLVRKGGIKIGRAHV